MGEGAIVSSISTLPTHLVGSLFQDNYALGQIIIDIIFGIAFACVLFLTERSRKIFDINPRSAKEIDIGIVALILWYILNVADLFLHEARIAVPYNYFFTEVPLAALKFCAEACFVASTYRIVILHLYEQIRKAKIALVFGEVLILVLLVTALYSLGSLVARQLVWLQLADQQTRNSFAWPQRKFEAAFFCIQFCMGFFATAFSGLNGWMIYETTRATPPAISRLFCASFSLWLWCTSEMAFVLKYHLGNSSLARNTGLARDAIFGLFTLIFLVMMTFDSASRPHIAQGDGNDLPPHLSGLVADIKVDYRSYIVEQLRAGMEDNQRPPPFAEFIADLRHNPAVAFRTNVRDKRRRLDVNALRILDDQCRGYVTELERRYGHLEHTDMPREV